MMPMIVFTGGGTAGHVAPNMALIRELSRKGWEIAYIGSASGIEKQMIEPLKIPFYSISSGKLRRYLSVKNLLDPFKIILGIVQSFFLLNKLKPDVIFSKGGFVAFPVVVGAWLNRIPVVAHESDMSPGLANRLCFPFVHKICLTFEAGKKHFKKQDKIEITGTPIREQLFAGNGDRGLQLCGFNADKPCLLVIGGSLGAGSINRSIRDSLEQLTQEYQIIHICGKGKLEPSLMAREGYKQFEYANEELADLFAAASIVISRAGANSLYEILALGKPHILIPLSAEVSRGDQIQNARYFQGLDISLVIEDKSLNTDTLLQSLHELEKNKRDIINKINALNIKSATEQIVAIIEEQVHVQSASTV
ncbi:MULTISPECIES: undecaprenyldiphospho-muramoylpentapeptide beta-N-acetylglucosaminyltransferase [Legionella]|uniref:UDP-N-acetylglucosamine--N-acetylmuramyl-(pentapeptide) pyrophosphoryl-undecaprenol N-acetylglucosamine transferase n=1 Tax=Legionella steelei TaxID=947033 RepID=A0A0W0ZI01_9GAMM|nr:MULTISPECIES: undecaprenyldiphospho-muramoylpentapeptide beta-N-acetylglucosaminyltransferase [Legionella]KTD68863.1 undecaprenyldiphospho-muramoylpentapeptide beta-N-acetylglucosaminyltransferase [Legionella steelei]MBN9227759.1 undecaprenyldiphospho-muramoylpentapeptide beta-N-acetylglucosaminyltransferase [Legionella steelei]OJW14559.1 MAG: undecaprenyldiphospho-muramoylpentapeptide beta-N-acetylglucosaminyltransferase [Legionella sp. 39-23]